MTKRNGHGKTAPDAARKRRRLAVGALVAAAGMVGVWELMKPRGGSAPERPAVPPVRMVTLTPPPPPPPPPAPPRVNEPPPEPETPKLVEQEPVAKDEPKPEAPKPADDPPPLGTGITGDGAADGFGLSGNGDGGGSGSGRTGGGRSGSRWGWYASRVQATVADALRRHPRTRTAAMDHRVRIWADASGRIVRAKTVGSTGDPSLDAAITEALTGVLLAAPPPADMPAPIVLRVAARRP
jgi:protein TonB